MNGISSKQVFNISNYVFDNYHYKILRTKQSWSMSETYKICKAKFFK